MNRIVIRASPPTDNDKIQRIISIGVPFIAVAAAILAAASDGTGNSNASSVHLSSTMQVVVRNNAFVDALVVLCMIYIISSMVRLRCGRRRFKEAAVEITQLGVQLVSIFGTSEEKKQTTDPECLSSATYKSSDKVKVRAFLPTQQIIDVVVIEMVWPHCVWSQVAFRVVKGRPIAAINTTPNSSMKSMNKDEIKSNTRRLDDESGDERDKSVLPPHATKRQHHNIHELLQEDRVVIIPCFPDECHGILTYKQCLQVQMQIETLLHRGQGCRES